ncbi:MAG: hypothetical protein A2Y23_08160 [Clostridiales bacterium GWB2_37_7]|nr:MAG: hypothetical protein A2Y23_08160 [Clostridiales bacterium GWB2_37_7]
MNNTLKVSKYLFHDFKKAMMIFYAIIFSIAIILVFLNLKLVSQEISRARFGGFGFTVFIFLFVSGLNCFKTSFRFMQANNISRKRFYYANIITLVTISAFMALIDTTMTNVIKLMLPYNSLLEQLYKNDFFFSNFIWSFALFTLAASAGWCITMLYYKCGKLMKTVVSLAPVLIIILLAMLNNLVKGAIGTAIIKFLTVALGFNNNNPYMAVFSFLIASAGAFGLCYLLIQRMPIKE